VQDPLLNAGEYSLSGATLALRLDTTTSDERWRISMTGAPVSGSVSEDGRRYGVQSEEIDLLIDREGLQSLSLGGSVVLAADNVQLSAASISLERNREGKLVSRGSDLSGSFNLAQLAGIEPVEVDEVLKELRP
jgi:hypothetical protein